MAVAGSYPANTYALEYLVEACAAAGLTRLVEVGVGHGTAIDVLTRAGLDVTGFDRDPAMVETSRQAMAAAGLDPDRASLGDIEDPASYRAVADAAPFDALLALGILPTATDEAATLRAMASLVRPGGHVFVEYRNVLFSLVTFNRHTRDFILDDLLEGVSSTMRQSVSDYLAPRLDLDRPPLPSRRRPEVPQPPHRPGRVREARLRGRHPLLLPLPPGHARPGARRSGPVPRAGGTDGARAVGLEGTVPLLGVPRPRPRARVAVTARCWIPPGACRMAP